nr:MULTISPECIES: DUF6159 family protein [Dyella]
MKASADILRSDKSLMVFPLLSVVCCLVVGASFLIPIGFAFAGMQEAAGGRVAMSPAMYAALFVFYLAQYFVIIFFNTALAGVALKRLRGEPASVAEGFAIARSRIVSIFGYALIAATVGLILRFLQERLGFLGRLVVGMFGLAWTVATFLVVPMLASQDIGPLEVVKHSAQLLKRTWGENIIGNAGIGLVFGLITLVAVLLAVALIAGAAATGSVALIITAVVAAVFGITTLALIQASLQGIYSAALYRYAEEGTVGVGFDQAMLENAFRIKKK